MGGYREGSGRSKSGYYKGIYCGSTYELCWVIYNLDHDIPFTRFTGLLKNNEISYYPDFIQGNLITEIKGYHTDLVDKKTELAKSLGYDIVVLYKEDLQYCFSYVQKKYGTKKFYTLYDDHKPKYTYVCSNCESQFSSEYERQKDLKFCTVSCSGKFRNKINTSNGVSDETKKKISDKLKGVSTKGRKRNKRSDHSDEGKGNISQGMKKYWEKKKLLQSANWRGD